MSQIKSMTDFATSKSWIDRRTGAFGISLFLGTLVFNGGYTTPITNLDSYYAGLKSLPDDLVDYENNVTSFDTMFLSESSLAEEWDTPEEDEAWADL